MEKFSEIDLGSTILSIAVAGGFVACGFVILRLALEALKALINNMRSNSETEPRETVLKNKQKGF